MIQYDSLRVYTESALDLQQKGNCSLDKIKDEREHLRISNEINNNTEERIDVRRGPSIQTDVKLSWISLCNS